MLEQNTQSKGLPWKRLPWWIFPSGALPLLLPFLIGPSSLQNFSSLNSSLAPSPKAEQTEPAVAAKVAKSSESVHPPVPQKKTELASAPRKVTENLNKQRQQNPRSSLAKVGQQPPISPKLPQEVPAIPLRVAVADGATSLAVGASTSAFVLDEQGQLIGQIPPMESAIAQPKGQAIQLGSWQAPSIVWIRPQNDGLIYIDGRWYQGSVQLILQEQQLLAVNHLDLEAYLYSVVGAEMPAFWPLEALKAQAIAARSYALVHIARPASHFYDLGASTRWQAYVGLESETNTTHAAVDGTRGLLLSYQGGVVESLYAASDNLITEAHGGYGMSQEGAHKLAQQRYNYQQILGHFFPGTHLAWMQVSR